jgi:proteasome assembly chaperone (PAC2) family protein
MIAMRETLRLREDVTLNSSIMLIGLHGWGNGGQVSTHTVQYLINTFQATRYGEIISDQYHHFQIERPLVTVKQGIMESYHPPKNKLFYWQDPAVEHDLLLLQGTEPHINWANYARVILELAKNQNVQRIFTIGGYLTDVASVDSLPVSASTNNSNLINELTQAEITLTNYTGPTSIYSEISWQGKPQNIDVISLWCGVPYYIKDLFPPAVFQILTKIQLLSDLVVDFTALQQEVDRYLETGNDSHLQRQSGTSFSTTNPSKEMYIA